MGGDGDVAAIFIQVNGLAHVLAACWDPESGRFLQGSRQAAQGLHVRLLPPFPILLEVNPPRSGRWRREIPRLRPQQLLEL